MGTKNNPGQFDCYAKLDPDEPYFTLRSTDPFSPDMVELWRSLAIGDIYYAIELFAALTKLAIENPHDMGYESDKAKEAYDCAEAMRQWKVEHP